MNRSLERRAYLALRDRVRDLFSEGRLAAEQAAIAASWRAGREIHEHVLRFAARADYGAQLVERLGAEVGVSKRVLYRCVQFARSYGIVPPAAQLTCAHYFALSRLEPGPARDHLAAEAQRRGWIAKELEQQVTAVLADQGGTDPAPPESALPAHLLVPKLGRVGHHRVVARPAGGLALDLGFKLYRPLTGPQLRGRSAGEIVAIDADGGIAASDATPGDLFTYLATITRVIDGDTLAVTVALPGCEMDEKLRLRGIDCPELNTAAGRAAKALVETLVAHTTAVTIATSKVDKYDRYLADVHLALDPGRLPAGVVARFSKPDNALATGPVLIHLNNTLLTAGHAVRMNASEMEWVP